MSRLLFVHRVMLPGILSVTLVLVVLAAPARAQTPPGDCTEPVPLDEITVGMTGHRVTVEQ